MIKVLVVDDEALLRTAFSSLIEAEDDLEVVGQAADGQQAVELAASLAPDVIVMDVRMPVLDGIEATRRITCDRDDGNAGPRVLILNSLAGLICTVAIAAPGCSAVCVLGMAWRCVDEPHRAVQVVDHVADAAATSDLVFPLL